MALAAARGQYAVLAFCVLEHEAVVALPAADLPLFFWMALDRTPLLLRVPVALPDGLLGGRLGPQGEGFPLTLKAPRALAENLHIGEPQHLLDLGGVGSAGRRRLQQDATEDVEIGIPDGQQLLGHHPVPRLLPSLPHRGRLGRFPWIGQTARDVELPPTVPDDQHALVVPLDKA
eukprot:CAMPEP_0198558854 /NCGR_PEP_ID=MMETSP1462-20131121/91235_1 /TAXON_ID=1333877 /ORGANISM="Brandtodinium nutriculum, Strain RCC3387" /LENGTH=174 /DNA_ID=CAMNT_0044289689 /DNA_START=278 /DNA_END=799 /DNA_ORIENTATION=+